MIIYDDVEKPLPIDIALFEKAIEDGLEEGIVYYSLGIEFNMEEGVYVSILDHNNMLLTPTNGKYAQGYIREIYSKRSDGTTWECSPYDKDRK